MSGCECKPDAKRKRGSAQPQGRAQPTIRMRTQRGFTLIEVLVAAGVLGITATALFGVLSRSLFNLRTVEDYHQYELAAQGLMNRALLLPTLPPGGRAEGTLDEKGARWVVQVRAWAPADLKDSPAEAVLRVDVAVTWPGRSIQRSIALETLRLAGVDYENYPLQEALEKIIPQ